MNLVQEAQLFLPLSFWESFVSVKPLPSVEMVDTFAAIVYC